MVHVDPVVRDCPVVGNGVFGYLHIHQLLARNVIYRVQGWYVYMT